jgi:hypothetical protein
MAVIIDATYSDLHKDVYGFRPRGVNFETQEEYDAEYERLVRQLDVVMEDERLAKIRAVKTVKDRLCGLMRDHGIDGLTALQWDYDAMGCDGWYGWEDYCYTTGIGFALDRKMFRLGIKPPLKFQQFKS